MVACVVLASIQGITNDAGDLTAVRLTGRSHCDEVHYALVCFSPDSMRWVYAGGGSVPPDRTGVAPGAAAPWTVDVVPTEACVTCGGELGLILTCSPEERAEHQCDPTWYHGVLECGPPPTDCPRATMVNFDVGLSCNDDGTRDLSIRPTIEGGPVREVTATVTDLGGIVVASDTVLGRPIDPIVLPVPAPASSRSSTRYLVTVTITGEMPGCTRSFPPQVVDVPGCGGDCPTAGLINVTLGECGDADCPGGERRRNVTFRVDITGMGASEIEWSIDGTPPFRTTPPQTTRSLCPGDYRVGATVFGPGACEAPAETRRFHVPRESEEPCPPPPTGGEEPTPPPTGGEEPAPPPSMGGQRSAGCDLLVYLIGFFGAVATVATIFAVAWITCILCVDPLCVAPPPDPGWIPPPRVVPPWIWWLIGGLWATFVALLVVWLFLCLFGVCPCNWCDVAKIAFMIAASASIATFWLADSCCPEPVWDVLAWASAGAAVAAFLAWVLACRPSICEIALTLILVFVSVAGIMFIMLGFFGSCASVWVPRVVGAIGILSGILAAATCSGASTST